MTGYIEHVTSEGERWDTIAYRYYGDAARTGPIIRANRELFAPDIPIPAVLAGGLKLLVPVLDPEPVAAELLPPWKRSAA